jgi:hypothetical protein
LPQILLRYIFPVNKKTLQNPFDTILGGASKDEKNKVLGGYSDYVLVTRLVFPLSPAPGTN